MLHHDDFLMVLMVMMANYALDYQSLIDLDHFHHWKANSVPPWVLVEPECGDLTINIDDIHLQKRLTLYLKHLVYNDCVWSNFLKESLQPLTRLVDGLLSSGQTESEQQKRNSHCSYGLFILHILHMGGTPPSCVKLFNCHYLVSVAQEDFIIISIIIISIISELTMCSVCLVWL